jgi:hypothetical protein
MSHGYPLTIIGDFTKEEEGRIGDLVGSSVTVGTGDEYMRHWRKWQDFLATVTAERRPQEYLENVGELGAKVKWLILFVDYLKNTRGGGRVPGGRRSSVGCQVLLEASRFRL